MKHAPGWKPVRCRRKMPWQTSSGHARCLQRDCPARAGWTLMKPTTKLPWQRKRPTRKPWTGCCTEPRLKSCSRRQPHWKPLEAAVRQAQLDLDRTRIQAPVAGRHRQGLCSAWVNARRQEPRSRCCWTVHEPFARVYVPEQLRADIVPGKAIEVRVDGRRQNIYRPGALGVIRCQLSRPTFALTEHDRSRLSYLAEIDIPGAADLPSGIPLQADFPGE